MSDKAIQSIISFLQQNNFQAICSRCDEQFNLKDAVLFSLDDFPAEARALLSEKKQQQKERQQQLKKLTADKRARVTNTTQSVNIGFILERLAPVLPAFPFHRNDCRSLFDPIDYVIFEGLSETGKVQKVFFVDIKTGGAKLKKNQKAIKQAVMDKKVELKIYKP